MTEEEEAIIQAQCQDNGHHPHVIVMSGYCPIFSYCACGRYLWRATDTQTTEGAGSSPP